jgi:hypothetical protein
VWIHRSGDYIVVELEAPDGSWVEAVREQADGNYSHIIEPLGIEACFEKHLNPAKSSPAESGRFQPHDGK